VQESEQVLRLAGMTGIEDWREKRGDDEAMDGVGR
jgi:hypothetical protein